MNLLKFGIHGSVAATLATLLLVLLPAGPAQADNCSGDPTPCSPRCVRLGKLYDQRRQAVERVYRRMARTERQINAAGKQSPANQRRLNKLNRRYAYLGKIYDRRHARLMRAYRKLLRCFG